MGLLVWSLLRELNPSLTMDASEAQETARRLLRDGGGVFALIARRSTDAVGVLTLNECASIYAGGAFGEISELFVTPPFRSRGVAAGLVEYARRFGLDRGWSRLEVGAPPQPAWDHSLAFYRREGYVEVGPRLKLAPRNAGRTRVRGQSLHGRGERKGLAAFRR